MKLKASGRLALMIAAVVLCWGSEAAKAATKTGAIAAAKPADSATAAKPRRAGAPAALKKFANTRFRHLRHAAHLRPAMAAKPGPVGRDALASASPETTDVVVLPPSVANANAQLVASEAGSDTTARPAVPARSDQAATPDAPKPVGANAEIVAADEVNDIDLADTKPLLQQASTRPVTDYSAAARNDDSFWPETSLIGKIFIAFGGLLTLASAARMFMA